MFEVLGATRASLPTGGIRNHNSPINPNLNFKNPPTTEISVAGGLSIQLYAIVSSIFSLTAYRSASPLRYRSASSSM